MLTLDQDSGVLIARIDGRLDNHTTGAIEQRLVSKMEDGAHRIVLDFSKVTYVASIGLRLVLLLAKRLKQAGGSYALFGLQASVREVFEVSGFDRILPVQPDERQAVEAVAPA